MRIDPGVKSTFGPIWVTKGPKNLKNGLIGEGGWKAKKETAAHAAKVWYETADADLTRVCFTCPANAHNNACTSWSLFWDHEVQQPRTDELSWGHGTCWRDICMRADKIKTRACTGTPTHLHAYAPPEQDAWIWIHCLHARGGVSSEKPHAYLLRVACCSVCMASCHDAVHLTTVNVCAIRSRKILSCGLPAAVPDALKLARIMPFCPFPRGIASQTEGGGQQLKMPCLIRLLFYERCQRKKRCHRTKRCQHNKEWQRKRRRQHKTTLLNEDWIPRGPHS